jgi:hypothetical protein
MIDDCNILLFLESISALLICLMLVMGGMLDS